MKSEGYEDVEEKKWKLVFLFLGGKILGFFEKKLFNVFLKFKFFKIRNFTNFWQKNPEIFNFQNYCSWI